MSTKSGQLTLRLFDAERKPFRASNVLVTLTDGYGRQVHRDDHNANEITFNIALGNNLQDFYTVNVAADNRRDSGFAPVHVTAQDPQDVYVMLSPKNPLLKFLPNLSDIATAKRNVHELLVNSGMTDATYQDFKQNKPNHLATLLNTLTALDDMPVGAGSTVLTMYYKSVLLDCVKPDRFYAQIDSRLSSFLTENTELYTQAGAGLHDARDCAAFVKDIQPLGSLKQTLFLESNVQFVFYEGINAGTDVVENDVDYFADTGAHLLMEVLPNEITKIFGHPILTDPRQVYVLRWNQSKNQKCWKRNQTPVGEFQPPLALN